MNALLFSLLLAASPAADTARPIHVQMKVTDAARNEVLFSTATSLAPTRSYQTKVNTADTQLEVVLDVQSIDKDEAVVRVSWNESNGKDRTIAWSPTVRVKRGTPAEVNVEWRGGGRTLSMIVE